LKKPKPPPPAQRCQTCSAYLDDGDKLQGRCRLNPPALMVNETTVQDGGPKKGAVFRLTGFTSEYPPVLFDGWCRQWERRT